MRLVSITLAAVLATTAPIGTALLAAETPVTDVVLTDLDGRERTLADLRGHVVVVNFWATWCAPCLDEMPMLARVHRDYVAAGVEFVGASADSADLRERIVEIVDETGVTFPIWVGADTDDMKALGLGEALPATAIVDTLGRIVHRLRGVVEERELRERLDALLASGGTLAADGIDHDAGDGHDALATASLDADDCCDHEGADDHGDAHHDHAAHEHQHGAHDHAGHAHDEPHSADASLVPS